MKLPDSILAPYIAYRYRRLLGVLQYQVRAQEEVFRELVSTGRNTTFGKDHGFEHINSYADFKRQVPLTDYEGLVPYIDRVKAGESDVLWKGTPIYFGITSGTTSQVKYIPITRDSLRSQLEGPQYGPIQYAHTYKKYGFLQGKTLIFSDGHFFKDTNGIPTAPISTIANSRIPWWYRQFSYPPDDINMIPEYRERIHRMIQGSMKLDIRTVVAMPVWLMVYLREFEALTGRTFQSVFPYFQLLLVSGMDPAPFRSQIEMYIRPPFDVMESYPSTEGFIAYQDRLEEKGMQLVLDQGIFYEFIPTDTLADDEPARLSLEEVTTGVNYALVISTNGGLWAYIIGDTVRFLTTDPYRIEITGRITQYISAFGEHVTMDETNSCIAQTAEKLNASIVQYTVGPNMQTAGETPYHEWLIEFGKPPEDPDVFAKMLDDLLCSINFSYSDLVVNKAIRPLRVIRVPTGGFDQYRQMHNINGFQSKIPQVTNNYSLIEKIRSTIHV